MNAQNLPSLASFSKASSYQICRLEYGKDENMTLSANHLQKLCLSSFREPFQPTAGFLSTENLASSARAFSCPISMVDHKVFCEEKQCLCWAGLLETSA